MAPTWEATAHDSGEDEGVQWEALTHQPSEEGGWQRGLLRQTMRRRGQGIGVGEGLGSHDEPQRLQQEGRENGPDVPETGGRPKIRPKSASQSSDYDDDRFHRRSLMWLSRI